MRLSIILAVTAVLAIPRLAAAEDVIAGYGEAAQVFSSMQGGMGRDFHDASGSRVAVGLRWRQLALGAGISMSSFDVKNTERHGTSIFDFTFGPELKVFFGPVAGFRPFARAAVKRHWMSGSSSVVRECREFGVCDAGFFTEEPDYSGHGVRAAIGVEYLLRRAAQRNTLVAFGAELGYEQVRFKVINKPVNGGMIGLTLSISVGGGRLIPYESISRD